MCPGISPDHIQEKPTFYRIEGKGNLCRKCWCLFNDTDWQYHRKAQVCRTNRNSQFTHRDFSLSAVRPHSLPVDRPPHSLVLTNNLPASEGQRKAPQPISEIVDPDQLAASDMLGIIQSIMSPLIREWLNRNRHVDVNVLVVYLTSGAMDFGTIFLSKPIVVPTW